MLLNKLIENRSKCSDNIKVIRQKMVVQYAFLREKRVIFNNFRYSVRFLDSGSNCDFRGGQISQFLVL